MEKIIKITFCAIFGLLMGLIAFIYGVHFINYEWDYSENNTMRGVQYFIHTILGAIFCTSPVWWLGSVLLFIKWTLKIK